MKYVLLNVLNKMIHDVLNDEVLFNNIFKKIIYFPESETITSEIPMVTFEFGTPRRYMLLIYFYEKVKLDY